MTLEPTVMDCAVHVGIRSIGNDDVSGGKVGKYAMYRVEWPRGK